MNMVINSKLDSTQGVLHVRPAVDGDKLLFWSWANDPDVRVNSFSVDKIPYDSHSKWFDSKLKSKLTCMYILELDGDPVGQIRYDNFTDGIAEVDFSITKAQRGHGFGTLIIEMTCHKACIELSVVSLVGFVKSSNQSSCRVFEKAGFIKNKSTIREGQKCEEFSWTYH